MNTAKTSIHITELYIIIRVSNTIRKVEKSHFTYAAVKALHVVEEPRFAVTFFNLASLYPLGTSLSEFFKIIKTKNEIDEMRRYSRHIS